jgi:LPXTG-motif cell wall-anchored protein
MGLFWFTNQRGLLYERIMVMFRLRWMGFIGVLFALHAFSPSSTLAQNNISSFTLQPGGKATINFEAFCTDYGLKFPLAIEAPNDVASDQLRGALEYVRTNGLASDPAKALEAQYAIWQLQNATGSPQGGADTQAVRNAGTTAPANPQGTSLLEAAAANQVRVNVTNWQPVGEQVQIGSTTDYFYGRGTVEVENTSQQELTLYMPVGSLFGPVTAGEQTMAGYATNVQVNNPVQTNDPVAAQLPSTGGSEYQHVLLLAALLLGLSGLAMRWVRTAKRQ